MATSKVKINRTSAKVSKADGSIFACSCKSTEFRIVEEPLHMFCKCGQIYTAKDLR